jgi:hypothetical protein
MLRALSIISTVTTLGEDCEMVTFASATRLPYFGYLPGYKNSIEPFLNGLFPSGPMSQTTQTFIWTESIYY